ncbi:hypothetical protein BJ170DRAFT_592378 [Xylariales sp. AK1849]|nr:hypothetical protein BJ170DRAFT_592378 [Xylariales sp. AK1849]
MCKRTQTKWHCKNCHSVVLVDTRSPVSGCALADARGHSCDYDEIEWTIFRRQAGTDVDPRESLSDPSQGTCFLSWIEFRCLGCQMDDELPGLHIHADSPELDTWDEKHRPGHLRSSLDIRATEFFPQISTTEAQRRETRSSWINTMYTPASHAEGGAPLRGGRDDEDADEDADEDDGVSLKPKSEDEDEDSDEGGAQVYDSR